MRRYYSYPYKAEPLHFPIEPIARKFTTLAIILCIGLVFFNLGAHAVFDPKKLAEDELQRLAKDYYENYHRVKINDSLVYSAVVLSERYITDRFLPDKAIDLIDEAASRLRIQIDSVPEALDTLQRDIMQLEIEREAIKRENDEKKLAALNAEIAEKRDECSAMKAKWGSEKELVNQVQAEKAKIEDYKFKAEKAEREGDYALVAELRYGKIKDSEEAIKSLEKQLEDNGMGRMIKEEVDEDDIAYIVSRWTGIPVSKMMQSEKMKLLHLEQELHKRVVGQDEAIEAVADAIRRSRAGLQDSRRPIGSFVFMGTTGVGKTELAKALAEYLFNTEDALIRFDMSEFQEAHSISRLVGSPPGYVGYDEGGQLTEQIRRKPYSVILFDEIEKAHPDIFNVLLQVLDDGRLTDNKGRTSDFKNTIVIMTSNLGSTIIQENYSDRGKYSEEEVFERTKAEVNDLLKKTLPPEFVNRIDEIVMFQPLSKREIKDIIRLQISQLNELLGQQNIKLEFTKYALELLVEMGYNPIYGARPLKRVIQKHILNELSKIILSDSLKKNETIVVDSFEDGKFTFFNQS